MAWPKKGAKGGAARRGGGSGGGAGFDTQVILVAIVASIFVAAVATAADWVWASQLLRHKMLYGLVHGAGLCGAMGLALGAAHRRPFTGLAGGLIAGVLAAASYYGFVFIPGFRRWAILASWAVLWILFGYLEGPFLRGSRVAGAIVRGVVAAAASGAVFYYVTAANWTRWNPQSIDYVEHFWRWGVAFLPGFLALLVSLSVQVRRTGGR
ncbi:MAG: hypothetical protein ABIT71_09080 [Vicinamibacteraceae bacterium]